MQSLLLVAAGLALLTVAPAAGNPCNPCAAKNPCNPCKAN